MPIMFNTILLSADFQLEDVRLLRHQAKEAEKGRTPYELWLNDPVKFDLYQSTQSFKNRSGLAAKYWASFVVTPKEETLFVGIYQMLDCKLLAKDMPKPHMSGINKARSCDYYELKQDQELSDLIGKLIIDWGPGYRRWIQHADRQNKVIIELRPKFKEPVFPGLLNFIEPLSKLDQLPESWISVLKSFRGVYLLSCPRTKEQYVGSATGESGFWGRMQDYIRTGHGGNVKLKSREPSNYTVSILEVAGTSSMPDEIIRMENKWKLKLQSREMGLNRN